MLEGGAELLLVEAKITNTILPVKARLLGRLEEAKMMGQQNGHQSSSGQSQHEVSGHESKADEPDKLHTSNHPTSTSISTSTNSSKSRSHSNAVYQDTAATNVESISSTTHFYNPPSAIVNGKPAFVGDHGQFSKTSTNGEVGVGMVVADGRKVPSVNRLRGVQSHLASSILDPSQHKAEGGEQGGGGHVSRSAQAHGPTQCASHISGGSNLVMGSGSVADGTGRLEVGHGHGTELGGDDRLTGLAGVGRAYSGPDAFIYPHTQLFSSTAQGAQLPQAPGGNDYFRVGAGPVPYYEPAPMQAAEPAKPQPRNRNKKAGHGAPSYSAAATANAPATVSMSYPPAGSTTAYSYFSSDGQQQQHHHHHNHLHHLPHNNPVGGDGQVQGLDAVHNRTAYSSGTHNHTHASTTGVGSAGGSVGPREGVPPTSSLTSSVRSAGLAMVHGATAKPLNKKQLQQHARRLEKSVKSERDTQLQLQCQTHIHQQLQHQLQQPLPAAGTALKFANSQTQHRQHIQQNMGNAINRATGRVHGDSFGYGLSSSHVYGPVHRLSTNYGHGHGHGPPSRVMDMSEGYTSSSTLSSGSYTYGLSEET